MGNLKKAVSNYGRWGIIRLDERIMVADWGGEGNGWGFFGVIYY
jgi:hypothetical protein